ncbi:SIR2 family protein [Aquicoccus sp. SU-CL01552]|uniref:SIR2 family NAD-dependent protein deacylase n=1 Tax=Aquicoccus sp. SU-CL01552 TaxID=3127656 RepID=UPI0031056864
MSEYFEIAYAAAAKRLCLFTGTGFSKALSENGAPGWQELLEEICDNNVDHEGFKEALFPGDGKPSLQLDEAAQVIDIELSKTGRSIHDEIANLIRSIDLAGSLPETEKFFKERSFRVVTTNYDKLAENLAETECQSLSPGRPIPRSNSRVKTFHVHGSIDVPRRMVVTADDYFSFMNFDSYFSRKLSTVLHENTVVILGYSLGDTNLKAILSDYHSFVRSHGVSNSIFLISRSAVDQRIIDYYSNCYGIRVIQEMGVEDFFTKINERIDEAEDCLDKSVRNINRVLFEECSFKEKYLQAESSFYQIVSAIGAIGVSLEEDAVVDTLADIISKKKELTRKTGAWPQYVQLASWLTYLGSLIDVKGTSLEEIYLDAVKFSMEKMSKEMVLGYSWHAYKVWDRRWSSLTAGNRSLVAKYIKEKSGDQDAVEIVSRS